MKRLRLKSLEEQVQELINKAELSNNRYFIGKTPLPHFIWNLYNPEDKIKPKDGYVIHHKNKIQVDDDIENLQKMTRSAHSSLYTKGISHSKEHRRKNSESHIGHVVSVQTRRRISRTRKGTCLGEANANAKITKEVVIIIRELFSAGTYSKTRLAKELNISWNTVYYVLKGETWSHI